MSKNLDLARDCGAVYDPQWEDEYIVAGLRFTLKKLDAFAERIRSEHKADAPEPSGERAALIKRLRDSGKSVMETIKDALQAADMLAADAPEQEPMFWVRIRSDGMYEGPIHNARIEEVRKQSGVWKPLYLAPLAPQARELSDDDLDLIWRKTLVDNQQEICQVTRTGKWFARAAVLAARSKL